MVSLENRPSSLQLRRGLQQQQQQQQQQVSLIRPNSNNQQPLQVRSSTSSNALGGRLWQSLKNSQPPPSVRQRSSSGGQIKLAVSSQPVSLSSLKLSSFTTKRNTAVSLSQRGQKQHISTEVSSSSPVQIIVQSRKNGIHQGDQRPFSFQQTQRLLERRTATIQGPNSLASTIVNVTGNRKNSSSLGHRSLQGISQTEERNEMYISSANCSPDRFDNKLILLPTDASRRKSLGQSLNNSSSNEPISLPSGKNRDSAHVVSQQNNHKIQQRGVLREIEKIIKKISTNSEDQQKLEMKPYYPSKSPVQYTVPCMEESVRTQQPFLIGRRDTLPSTSVSSSPQQIPNLVYGRSSVGAVTATAGSSMGVGRMLRRHRDQQALHVTRLLAEGKNDNNQHTKQSSGLAEQTPLREMKRVCVTQPPHSSSPPAGVNMHVEVNLANNILRLSFNSKRQDSTEKEKKRSLSPPRENIKHEELISRYSGSPRRAGSPSSPRPRVQQQPQHTRYFNQVQQSAAREGVRNSYTTVAATTIAVSDNHQQIRSRSNVGQTYSHQSSMGDSLDQLYEIHGQIGTGSYAVVNLALDKKRGNRLVAIKVYQKSSLADPVKMKNVQREIEILQQIRHPNIIRLYEVVERTTTLNLVLEYIGSESLYSYLKAQPKRQLCEEEARVIISQVVSGVKYLHLNGVVHRDIKLENILVDEKKRVKLIDFGFAVAGQLERRLNSFCGTPSYMAPEIVQKRPYIGPPADVWSIGVLLFVLFCGAFPFKGKDEEDLFKKIAKCQLEIPVHVPLGPKGLITRILQQNPRQRPTLDQILGDSWMIQTAAAQVGLYLSTGSQMISK